MWTAKASTGTRGCVRQENRSRGFAARNALHVPERGADRQRPHQPDLEQDREPRRAHQADALASQGNECGAPRQGRVLVLLHELGVPAALCAHARGVPEQCSGHGKEVPSGKSTCSRGRRRKVGTGPGVVKAPHERVENYWVVLVFRHTFLPIPISVIRKTKEVGSLRVSSQTVTDQELTIICFSASWLSIRD